MCRSIKDLRRLDHHATEDEFREAALQYVRKISGFRKPSRMNEAAFETAVAQISESSRTLLVALTAG